MPTLTIDNREVTVPEGTNVLEAARALDIVIPHFCYHEALGAVGSCRLCAMSFLEGPLSGVRMACMVKAEDGMVVSTTDAEAVELRQHVIEWTMTNHPHDCPVCDEGGECQLQEMTVAGGHGMRRYRGRKATYTNQDLGPFVQQEMNRCITCYRCVRTYRDYCGGSDYGVFGSRNRVFFGRFRSGPLESPFSGNIIDVCPTGVLTSKPFRFKTRRWDLQEAPSICPHCSLGCAVVPGGRYRELQRVRAGLNRDTNGFFICDRGRFGYAYVNHPERPRQARIDGREASVGEALAAVGERLTALIAQHGADSVALLGSARASFEANALLGEWAKALSVSLLSFEANAERDRAARVVATGLGDFACSLEQLRRSDLVLLVGADPLAEAPMLALALRQAVRGQGRVFCVDPRPVELPCAATRLTLPPQRLTELLGALTADDLAAFAEPFAALAAALNSAERPVLVGGADLLGGAGLAALLRLAAALSTEQRRVGVVPLLGGPNSCGGGLLSSGAPVFDELLDTMQEGRLKALLCLEADPFREALDPGRAQAALGHLELLVSIDQTPSLAAQRADILLPARAVAEMAGSYVNNEGRLQAFLPVLEPGQPIAQAGQGGHPPRRFCRETPGSQPRADWALLAGLYGVEADLSVVRKAIAAADARFAALPDLAAEGPGVLLSCTAETPAPAPRSFAAPCAADALVLLAVAAPAGSDWLAHLSAPWAGIEPEPCVTLNPRLAARLGFAAGERLRLHSHLGHCYVTLRCDEGVADELVLAPQLWGTAFEALTPGSSCECRLEREGGA
jgi:NADH-quinone oxidoreductase subunit G